MDFMDLDIDLEADPVKEFLNNKLEEIKHGHARLRESLQELEDETEEVIGQTKDILKEVSIEKSWIKLINDKYAIWFSVRNKMKGNSISCRLILSWDSTAPLLYKCCMYEIPEIKEFEKNFHRIDTLDQEAYIAIVLDRPEFLEQRKFEITGLFSFTLNSEEYDVELPKISIAVEDATDRQKIVPIYKLIESHIPDFVSCLASSYKTKVVMKTPNIARKISSILEIDAGLYNINFGETSGRFFLAHKISPIFDGSIVEISESENIDTSKASIYHRNGDSLISFVHHLYQNIGSLILLPEEFEIRLHCKSTEDCEALVKRCMLREIEYARKFRKDMQNSGLDNEKIRQFLLELCDLEHATDKAYVQMRVAQDDEGSDINA